jgi:hypothetical protein
VSRRFRISWLVLPLVAVALAACTVVFEGHDHRPPGPPYWHYWR